MKPVVTIKEIGFSLRPFEKSDYKILRKKIFDRTIYRNTLQIVYPYSINDARQWLGQVVRRYRQKTADTFHLAIDIDGEVAGSIGISEIIHGHKAELGYWLGRQHRGQGIMSAAISAMVKYCFKRFKLKKIYAYVFVQNKASYRVLVKNGFKKEGLLIQNIKKDGKLKDEYILAKYKK